MLNHSFEFVLGKFAERDYVIFIGEDVHIDVQGEPALVHKNMFVDAGIVSDIASVTGIAPVRIVILRGNIVIFCVVAGF